MSIYQFNNLLLFLNLIITIINIFLWLYFLKKIQEVKLREKQLENDFSRIIEHAHVKSESIIEDAVQKANAILNETRGLKSDIDIQLQKTARMSLATHINLFKEASQRITSTYESLFLTMRQQFIDNINKLSNKVQQLIEDNLRLYQTIIKDEASIAQFSIREKVDEEFARAQKEIEIYRKNELSYINKSIGKIVMMVAKEIIGREITLQDQEKLLFEALEKAKKQGLFNN